MSNATQTKTVDMILTVPAMVDRLTKHYAHNAAAITDLIDIDALNGRPSRPALIESEKDMRALLVDNGRILAKAKKLVAENRARLKLAREMERLVADNGRSLAQAKFSRKGRGRKVKQVERSLAAEAAKDKRAATTPANKGQGGQNKGKKVKN